MIEVRLFHQKRMGKCNNGPPAEHKAMSPMMMIRFSFPSVTECPAPLLWTLLGPSYFRFRTDYSFIISLRASMPSLSPHPVRRRLSTCQSKFQFCCMAQHPSKVHIMSHASVNQSVTYAMTLLLWHHSSCFSALRCQFIGMTSSALGTCSSRQNFIGRSQLLHTAFKSENQFSRKQLFAAHCANFFRRPWSLQISQSKRCSNLQAILLIWCWHRRSLLV